MVFLEQRAIGLDVWQDPLVDAALPQAVHPARRSVRARRPEGMDYRRWRLDRAFLLAPAQGYVAQWMQSFKEFPPRQKPGILQPQPRDGEADEAGAVARARRTPNSREGGGVASPPPAPGPLLDCAPGCHDAPAEPSRASWRPHRAVGAQLPIGAAARALLLASGAAALVFETLWVKQLGRVVGVEVHAVTLALSAFFAGLALGGAAFGRLADRTTRPLRLYALARGGRRGSGVRGHAGPLALGAALRRAPGRGRPAGLAAAVRARRLPAFLMGGTLPALLRALRPGDGRGRAGDRPALRARTPPAPSSARSRRRSCSCPPSASRRSALLAASPRPGRRARPRSPSIARRAPLQRRPARSRAPAALATPGSRSPSTPSPAASRSATRSSGPSCSCSS